MNRISSRICRTGVAWSAIVFSLSSAKASTPPPYRPTTSELRASYARANGLYAKFRGKALNLYLRPHWYLNGNRFWYEWDGQGGAKQFISVNNATGKSRPLFDAARLASALSTALGQPVQAAKLPISMLTTSEDGSTIHLNVPGKSFEFSTSDYILHSAPALHFPIRRFPPPWRQNLWPPDVAPIGSPDGKWTARSDGLNVVVTGPDGKEFTMTTNGNPKAYFARVEWRPDSKKLIAFRVIPGDRKKVYLIQSSPPGGGRAILHSRVYDLPGDKVDSFEIWVLDPVAKTAVKVNPEPLDGPFGEMPQIRWTPDKIHFTYEKLDRGYQRWRLIRINTDTDNARTLIDEQSKTFIDSTSQYIHYCASGEFIFRSERSGWGQLYLYSPNGRLENRITHGKWVVRGVAAVDEKKRQIVLEGSGINTGEDPYFIHYYRVNFDGTGFTSLTPAVGDHHAVLSPDGTTLLDSCSTVQRPPTYELRRVSDGALLDRIGTADISRLIRAGWRAPEPFVAKGRDGVTNIYGLLYRPEHFDAHKSYPILEDIYAGPQDSFVPKDFAPYRSDMSMAEIGFMVVKIDGMGTRNRSKAFQDVCWHNLKDAGFPDRILWIKALAKKYPYLNLKRVGIYGTSAGGQESTAALLFHPNFYKVAVSSSGCQDNRLDKLWWNEQWLGYPVGPQYSANSNIDNAWRLKGHLFLFVSEMDHNVPPENTLRLVNALVHDGKDFDMRFTPGVDHGMEGPSGERKRRDFFVRYLDRVEPPNWNADANEGK